MTLKDWLESKAEVPNTALVAPPATATPDNPAGLSEEYANAFINAGIDNDETKLPELGLTLDDLRELGVGVGFRRRVLAEIQKLAPPTPTLEPSEEAKDRHDLIKRIVPIALSVGFAARLAEIPWFKDGTVVSPGQWEQLARLLVGVFVAVSGWEWYHRDLRSHPLDSPSRFYIDVAVVITTIIFLYSGTQEHWLWSLVAIFVLYVVWDISVRCEYPNDFKPSVAPLEYQPQLSILTNVIWLLHFVAIAVLTHWFFLATPHQAFVVCVSVFAGALALRLLPPEPIKMSFGGLLWVATKRAAIAAGLVVAFSLVSYFHVADKVVNWL